MPEATTRPPRPPRTLSPSAIRKTDTQLDDTSTNPKPQPNSRIPRNPNRIRGIGTQDRVGIPGVLRGDVPAAGAHGQTTVTHFELDGVPAVVLLGAAGIPQVVLLAQLVGDSRGGGVEAVEAADDLRPAAGVVSDLPQRIAVDALAAAGTRPGSTDLRERRPASPREGERDRHRHLWRPCRRRTAPRRAVHAQRVDQHLALANQLPQLGDAGIAVGVVA